MKEAKKIKKTNIENSKKVFVAMSGGVDSSVSAYLLKKQGYDVTGVFMKNWSEPIETYSKKKSLCWVDERRDAIRVAAKIGIPLLTFDFEKEYKKLVVDYMYAEYKAGRTPNPDIQCNKLIKFPLFLKKSLNMGADFIATGHYLKIKTSAKNCESKLFQGKDKEKDQSYFLWTLEQSQLKYCLFPIGDYLKTEVRQIAEKIGLANAQKKGTAGICFIGEVKLREFLKKKIKEKPGNIITTDGKIVGQHPGISYFTIGQRHGLEISGQKPYYVASKDIKKNILIVAEGKNNPALFKKEIELKDINFINPAIKNRLPIAVYARVRYRQPLAKGVLRLNKKSYKLIFNKPQKFVAAGQSAVFYTKAKELLGGGVIK